MTMNNTMYEINCVKCNSQFFIPFQTERDVYCPKCLDEVKEKDLIWYLQFLRSGKFVELEGSEINGILYDCFGKVMGMIDI